MASELSRPWLERQPPTHPLLAQLADSRAFIGVHGPEEVLRVVFAAYRTVAAGRDWDPSAGTTTPDAATVQACERLGRLLRQAGDSDFEHGIQPGPVFHFDGGTIGLDLRFGDPDDDGARSRRSPRASRSSAARSAASPVLPLPPAAPDLSRSEP